MKLSSALSLKAQFMDEARSSLSEAVTFAPRMAARSAAVTLAKPRPVAAFGVAPRSERRDDYAVAVRVFEGQEDAAGAILEEARELGDEADIATGLRYKKRATLAAGGSCGHYNITAGTLGGFVQDDDNYYMLSNNHVLADCDRGVAGDPIYEPGPDDIRGGRFRVIGRLHSWVPLTAAASIRCDAAIATFTDEVRDFYPWWYRGIGDTRPTAVEDRFEVIDVVKRGRTTGLTRGAVSAYDLDGVAVDYADAGQPPRIVTFDNQIEMIGAPVHRAFSQPGDSGSFIFDARTLRPYCLLYAGGPDASGIDRTLGQFLPDVLDALGVRLVR